MPDLCGTAIEGGAQQCVHAMLAGEHDLNYRALLGGSRLQADVARIPALHKHFNVSGNPSLFADLI